jgi:urease accessory protein UreF
MASTTDDPIPTEPAYPSRIPTHPTEQHLLHVLLDSNLPTGGFISSSGLESFAKHGLLDKQGVTQSVVAFARAEIENYRMMTLCFVVDAWNLVTSGDTLDKIVTLDMYHESTTLSHVARRSSKAQGVAMLTLYARGLCPSGTGNVMIDEYKRLIRQNKTPGHLAVCWGVITAVLGLPLGTSSSTYPTDARSRDPLVHVSACTITPLRCGTTQPPWPVCIVTTPSSRVRAAFEHKRL